MNTVRRNDFIREYSKAINEGYAAAFVGAGFSFTSGFVDWRTLIKPFAEELGLRIEEEFDLARVAQYYRNEKRSRQGINQEIINRFSLNKDPSESIKVLTRLPIYTYWTTNYDKLIEEGLRLNNRKVDIKITQKQLVNHKRDRDAVLYKMHGDVDFADEAVLTKEDYEIYNSNRSLFSTVLQGDLVSKTFLFLGFSFDDPNIDSILARTRNIFGETVGNNYWIEKAIQCPTFDISISEEEQKKVSERYIIDQTKQKLKVNELLRYGIQTVLINSYDEIFEILKELEFLYLRNNIFISGSIEEYSVDWPKSKVEQLCFKLSNKLISKNKKVYSGFGIGIGSSVINGALNEIYHSKYKNIDEHLILRPFPQKTESITFEELKSQWTEYRLNIIKDIGVSIFLFGNKKVGDEIQLANGMMQEFEISRQLNRIIIPVGSTGLISKAIFDIVKSEIREFSYLSDYLEILEKSNDIDEIVDIILKIVL